MSKKAKKNKNKNQRRFQQLSQIQKQITQQTGSNNPIASNTAFKLENKSLPISEIKYNNSQNYAYVIKDLSKVALFFVIVLIVYGCFYYIFNYTELIKF